VETFNWPAVSAYIERRVRSLEGASWDKLAEGLGRLGYWEFEDYQS
jgi:hypothetical protein